MSAQRKAEEMLIQINGQLQALYQAGDYQSIEAIAVAVDEQVSGGERDVPNVLSRILHKIDEIEARQRRQQGRDVPNGWRAAALSQAWRSDAAQDDGCVLMLRACPIQRGAWTWEVQPEWIEQALPRTIQFMNPPFGLRLKEVRIAGAPMINIDEHGVPAGVFRQEFRVRNRVAPFNTLGQPLTFRFAFDGAEEHVGEDLTLVMWIDVPMPQWGNTRGTRGLGTSGLR